MGMRDWLIIIVIVGIILILLDGYRRKRKDSIRVKLEKNIPSSDSEHAAEVELPNGGARVISRDDDMDVDFDDEEAREYEDESNEHQHLDGEKHSAEYLDDEDQTVPVLMDAVDIDDINATDAIENYDDEDDEELSLEENDSDTEENTFDSKHEEVQEDTNTDDLDLDGVETEDHIDDQLATKENASAENADSGRHTSTKNRIEPTLGEVDSFSEAELDINPKNESESIQVDSDDEALTAGDQAELFAESPEDFIQSDEEHEDAEDDYLEPEEVIVINVMAKQGELFAGSDLLPIIMQQGMQLGKMSIFHKHADSSGNGPVIFSMANMLNPGTFDVAQMEEFATPGVSFFLQLPNAFGNMKSFEQMLNAADSIKESLNGDLKDEHRSVITRQTIEHCRQRIQDFELAQLSKK